MDDVQNKYLISPKVNNVFKINSCNNLVVEQGLPGRFLLGRMYPARRIGRILLCEEKG
jgi:hypothetical protein